MIKSSLWPRYIEKSTSKQVGALLEKAKVLEQAIKELRIKYKSCVANTPPKYEEILLLCQQLQEIHNIYGKIYSQYIKDKPGLVKKRMDVVINQYYSDFEPTNKT